MSEPDLPDHYEALQLAPHADRDTIERVFRLLAKRFHPDNPDSGDADRFGRVVEAFRVLSDPEQRARYDIVYERARETKWRVFDQEAALSDIAADKRVRAAILSLLYTARRNDADHPGVGIIDLERLLSCPEHQMKFHLWYLKEQGLLARTEAGAWAITAAGVDRVLEEGGPGRAALRLLDAGTVEGDAA